MKNTILIFILIHILSLTNGFTQSEMMNVKPNDDTALAKSGPNLKYFVTYFIGYGQAAGPSESSASPIKYGACPYWTFGYRYKLKLTSSFSTGFEFQYNQYNYGVKQTNTKQLPDSILHKKERIKLYSFSLAPYVRLNFDRHRGNYMGYFLDLGAFADWNFIKQHITNDKLSDGTLQKVSLTRLPYVEPYRYGVYAQFGMNKYLFFCNYYFANLFTSGSGYDELPQFIAGIKISFHK